MNQLALELLQLDEQQLMEMFEQVKTSSPLTSLFEYEVHDKQTLVKQIALTLTLEEDFLQNEERGENSNLLRQ